MKYCIPKDLINILKPKLKALGGQKLMNMERAEMEDFFSEVVDRKMAQDITSDFRKAMLSYKKGAMKKWARSLFPSSIANKVDKEADNTTDTTVYKNIDGDVMERALGVDLTAKEVDKINELTKKMQEAEKLEPNEFTGISNEYFDAKRELDNYINTIAQLTIPEVLSMVIFRGNLLFGVKSVVTNIVGNVTGGVPESIVMRLANKTIKGVNRDIYLDYMKSAYKIYNQNGVDTVRAMEVNDGNSVLGDYYKGVGNGKGIIRSYGRFTEQWVLRMGQGAPDILFASYHFINAVDIMTTVVADNMGLKGAEKKAEARRLLHLATSLTLDPNNPEHAIAYGIKQRAVQHALTATYQNDTQWTKNAIAIRNSIDDYTGSLQLGTNLIPFVKTLINIAKLSIDMSGFSLPEAGMRMYTGIKMGETKEIKRAVEICIRTGLGMTLATLLASALDDDDYMPDYSVASSYQKDIARLNNIPYNAIRIGDKWVSLAYFGTFGYALSGMLSAKQKQGLGEKTIAYTQNALIYQLRQTPILQQAFDIYDYSIDVKKFNKDSSDVFKDSIAFTSNFFISRLIPSITGDIVKVSDDYERYTRVGFEGIKDQFQARIPFWREVLPQKYNALGDPIKTERWYWIILTGSRLKTALPDTGVVKELTRLSASGEEVSLRLTGYKDVKTAKEILSQQEFYELNSALSKELTNAYANIMGTNKYKREKDPEKQKAQLYEVREKVMKKVLRRSGYRTEIIQKQKADEREKKLKNR